jgi:hypothetical protein
LALARAARAGIDPAPIARAAGLAPELIEDRKARISVQSQIAVLNLVADRLHDDLLGFHLAERFDLREIGLFYYVLASSATLGEALARTERYSMVTNESIGVECRHEGDLYLRVSYLGVPRHADRHQIEFWTTALLRVCRRVTDTDLKPTHVSLAHPRRASSSEIESLFRCKIDFAAGRDEIAFARGALQLPLLGADPYLSDLLVEHCKEVLARRNTRTSPIRASVENAIAPVLPHGKARVTVGGNSPCNTLRTRASRFRALPGYSASRRSAPSPMPVDDGPAMTPMRARGERLQWHEGNVGGHNELVACSASNSPAT